MSDLEFECFKTGYATRFEWWQRLLELILWHVITGKLQGKERINQTLIAGDVLENFRFIFLDKKEEFFENRLPH